MRDVAEWLDGLGLGQYRSSFAAHDIDFDVLKDLTDGDLESLGVSLGHRRKMLRAIGLIEGDRHLSGKSAEAAERRNLTVMFCDLVGSAALSSRLDPEELRSGLMRYQDLITETVVQLGGFVARYMGDGLLIYFGWPTAAEDDAERAVSAGLRAIEAVGELRIGPEPVQVRLGIATGLAVVGDLIGIGAAKEQSVIGEVPNLAARLQSLAAPNTVVISAATRQLIGGRFELEPLGALPLKGWDAPIPAWRVVAENRGAIRFPAAGPDAAVFLVNRVHEMQLLRDKWAEVEKGLGRVMLLVGEAGIGKSKTVAAFAAGLSGSAHRRATFQCLPHHSSDALHPIVRQIERVAGFAPTDPSPRRLDKLEAWNRAQTGAASPVDLGLFAALLSLPTDGRYPAPDPDPQRRKRMTLALLVERFELLASREPLLLLLEDAHWIDPTTLELFEILMLRLAALPALMIVTCRPDFVPFESGTADVTTLIVTRLNRADSGELIRQVAGGKGLPDQLLGQIQTKTDGVPLFVEELTKTVLESGGLTESEDRWLLRGPSAPLSIPASLQDSLMARLDRLGWAKELAQVAAAVGREFSHAVFVVVARRSTRFSARLEEGMTRLIDAQLLFGRGAGETLSYYFKHALVQDAAYASMLHSRRRELHRRIAEVLETTFPEIAETQPEMIAHHLTEAQLDEPAVTWWRRAGQRNVHASANIEAIANFERGLALLAKLPEASGRDAAELDIRIDLGVPLMGTVGYTAPEFQHNTRRALEICERIGDQGRLYPVLWSLVAQTFSAGDVTNALPIAERFLQSAERQGDRQLCMIGHRLYGMTLYGHGDLQPARHHLERALELYDHDADASLTYAYGADQRVAALSYLGRTLHQLGYPEQGIAMVEEAMMAARLPGHVNTIIYARNCMMEMRLMRREFEAMTEEAVALGELAQGHAAHSEQIAARAFRQVMDLGDVDVRDALEGIGGGIRELRGLNWNYWATRICLVAAEACVEAGRVSHGRDWLEQARSLIEGPGQDLCLPELYRLNAAVLRAENAPVEAVEADLRRAVAIARAQSARWSELRCTTNLARLLRDLGQPAEAVGLLGPVYDSFVEGRNLPDLIEAKDLLDSLRGAM